MTLLLPPTPEMQFRWLIVAEALRLVGRPYWWAGNDPAKDPGLDCSGFVLHVWRQSGIPLPDMTAQMIRERCESIDAEDALPGDVAFYGKPERAWHVVLLLAPEGKAIIGANGGNRIRQNEAASDYQARMARAKASVRIEDHRSDGLRYRTDLVGVGRCPILTP